MSDPMSEAIRRQFEHVAAAHQIDRRGWTRQQWVDDARRLLGDIDGSVLDLLNGHTEALLAELDRQTARANEVRHCEVCAHSDWMADCPGAREQY